MTERLIGLDEKHWKAIQDCVQRAVLEPIPEDALVEACKALDKALSEPIITRAKFLGTILGTENYSDLQAQVKK